VTIATIKHCERHVWGYRVSSSLFPLLTHPDFNYEFHDVPQCNELHSLFKDVTENEAWKVRLSMHPDQFNVLASENDDSVNRTIRELNHNGWLMDKMGCLRGHWNPMNIHVNNTKGDPKQIADRFFANLARCDHSVTSRLVVENEDKGIWNVETLLEYFYKPHGIPITFDTLHHSCNPSTGLITDSGEDNEMEMCDLTWDTRPIFHYSESHPNKPNPRSHADDPTDLPPRQAVDWDIELKNKDKAIRQLYLIERTRESQRMASHDI
jgi:UV DNA damage endonuclease